MPQSKTSVACILILLYLGSCTGSYPEKNAQWDEGNQIEEFRIINDTLVNLTELEPCDILVKPNINLFAGTAMVNGGKGFGHVVLVIDGGKDSNTMRLLERVRIFESHARDVPKSYELRSAPGFLDGDDFRFANTTFGMQNAGYRYRLRFNLTPSQRDSIINFVLDQDPDVSSWRSLKQLKSNLGSGFTAEDKKIWYCSLLIWQAFYQVVGIDLDANGGIMVFPNDLIASPYFDNDMKNTQKRVRF